MVVAAALIAVLLLRPDSSSPQTPTAQPTSASAPTAEPPPPPPEQAATTTASSTDMPGLAPFVGIWQAHTQKVVIDSAGNGQLSYQGCTACATPTENTVDFTLTSVSNGIANGNVTTTTDAYYTGKPVLAVVTAGSPGHHLEITIGGLRQAPLCDGVAEAAGQCGA